MAINFVTGLPRAGKTLWTICRIKEIAEKENRQVYTCNIPGVTIPGWEEIDHPDKWMELPDGCIVVVDELQDFWQKAPSGSRVPLPILELSKHGKRGIDFYFITQEPELVHQTPRALCQHHYYVVRAFGSHNAAIYKFERMRLHPDKVKTKGEKFPWRYNKEAFNWYKSADTHNVKREIPLKVWAIPGGLVLAGLAIWAAFGLFGKVIDDAKSAGKVPGAQAGATAPSVNAAAAGQAAAAGPLTVPQYIAARSPRLPDFPHTAPAYDQVTQPTEAPYPAACVTMGKTCKCYTQQATLLQVSGEVCLQIVAQGFFMDWRKAEQPRDQVQPYDRNQAQREQPAQLVRAVPIPHVPDPQPGFITQGQLSSALAVRNPAYVGKVVPGGQGG